jgi:HEAT repeat protein
MPPATIPPAVQTRIFHRLQDPDERVRAAAAVATLRIDSGRFGRPGAKAVKDPSPTVRAAMAAGLATVPGRLAWAALETLRGDADPTVRVAAARAACVRSEPAARAACRELLASPDPALRAVAVAAAEPAELTALQADEHAEVRAAALGRALAGAGPAALGLAARACADAPEAGPARALALVAWLASRG